MKKIYVNPSIKVVKIHTRQQMLLGSTTLGLGADGSANNAESRFLDLDFDDEEE